MKSVYIRCPRCELNFILKKDRYCPVCKQEMQALATNYADDANKELGLCPICKVNYITEEETVCSTCMNESDLTEDELDALYGGVVVEHEEATEDLGDSEDELEIISLTDMSANGGEVDSLDEDEEEEEADPLDDFDESLEYTDDDEEEEEEETFDEDYD